MNWYHAEGGEQKGPLTSDELADLVRSGRVTDETLVWREGLPGWEPFGRHRPAVLPDPGTAPEDTPPAEGAQGTETVTCTVCGQSFPSTDTIVIAGHRTCAGCKPTLLQRLAQGTLGTGIDGTSASARTPEETVASREYSVDATGLVGEAWNLVFREPGLLLLGPVLGTIAYYAVVAGASVLNLIPFVGGMVSGFLISLCMGPYLAGIYALFLTRLRGRPADVSLVFAGCTRRVADLLLSRLYLALTTVGLNLVILLALGSAFVGIRFNAPGTLPQLPPLPVAIAGGVGYLAVLLVYMYLAVCWIWAIPLVFDKGYAWRDALRLSRRVVHRHWWQHFWLLFLGGLLATAGMLACCIGVLVAIPVVCGMLALQYQRLFEDLVPVEDRP